MTTQPQLTPLAQGFAPASEEQWQALLAKVLNGGTIERITSRTADGISVAPLYTRADEIAGTGEARPGAAPFTRGGLLAGGRWDIRQIHAEADPARANADIRADIAGGATSIALQIAAPGAFGLPYTGAEMAAALDGVDLARVPVALIAGEYTVDAAGSLMALWRARGIPAELCRGALNADPLGNLARTGSLYHPLDRSLAIAARLAADTMTMPGVSALIADGHLYHAAGASEAQELAAVLGTLVAYLRACEAMGIAPADTLPRMTVGLAADADIFTTIAKLRAARRLVWRVAEACGAGETAGRVPLVSATAWRMLARRDPWVNMLRGTIACAAAALGGAQSILVLPFTWALGRPDAFARRIARNTQHVLMAESGLDRIIDPAGGSWYVERLSDELAKKAWSQFQAWEADGGFARALAGGRVQDAIAATAAERARQVATGRLALTGVSAFPQLAPAGITAEPWPLPLASDLNGARARPLAFARLAEPYERLRDAADAQEQRTGQRPGVFLASLGPLAEHGPRSTFIANLLAAGGIEGIAGGDVTASAEAAQAFARSGAALACICGTDESYALLAEAAAMALKGAGARRVYLAGRPGTLEGALRAAGVDGFIHAGCDQVATLEALLAELAA